MACNASAEPSPKRSETARVSRRLLRLRADSFPLPLSKALTTTSDHARMCSVVLLDWPRFPSPHYTVGFPGHVQRFFNHTSHMGYRYIAAELSIGCPVGLSGAPVFNSTHMGRLYGVVAEYARRAANQQRLLAQERHGSIDGVTG